MTSQATLRQQCRQRRRSLPPELQQLHAQTAARFILRSRTIMRARKVAVFLSEDGEMNTMPLIQALWQRKVNIYLPVLTRYNRRPMMFAPFTTKTKLEPKYFGIHEPQVGKHELIDGKHLDLVITPLACFDASGNRIGMGGGYYDKTFQFKRYFKNASPKLIGWAHQCQEVKELQSQPWDVRLNGLVTEMQFTLFNN
ncbi:5-formyltetrahydrofolate cyclo-ligase [Hydrogenovibrio kuenenii]|uniref:5-formyltetrahydrofolate cyclo-ligase n=1 Tax=Hydrogenovibrio kuenenii TaxID=63658 RepID=UPI0004657916|nr:5-formyltetrahydrofolate cyclo-ligase [Hydrogenovibrio kuenenii]